MNARTTLAGLLILAALPAAQAQSSEDISRMNNQHNVAQQALQRGHDFVLEEKWAEASEAFGDAFDVLMATANDQPQFAAKIRETAQEPFFWKCFADEKRAAPAEEVAECYEIFVLRYPDSKWADDARRNLARIQQKEAEVRFLRELEAENEQVHQKQAQNVRSENAQEQVLMTTIYALAEQGNDEVVPQLKRLALTSASEQVRLASVQALNRVGTVRSQEVLVEVVQSDARPRVRREAIYALANLQSKPGLAATQQVAQDKREEQLVREAAVQSLGQMRSPNVVPALARIAGDASEDAQLRRAAIEALDRVDTPEARAALVKLLNGQE